MRVMIEKTKSLICFLFIVMILTLPVCAQQVIKIATVAPDGSTWMNLMNEFRKEIMDKTSGEVEIKFYPGGVQGDEKDVIRKMRIGQLHGGGFTGNGLGEILPAVRVLEAPFLFKDYDEVHYVREKMADFFEKYFQDNGFVVLGWADVGFVYLFSDTPVRNVEDVKKKKLWIWEGDPLAKTFIEGFGISPIPLALPDVMTSLQTKLIDTIYTSPYAAVGLQWFTKVKFMTDYPITNSVGAVVVDKRKFDKLKPEHQTLLKETAKKYFDNLMKTTLKDNEDAKQIMKNYGLEFVQPDASGIDAFNKVGVTTRNKLIGVLYSREVLDIALKHLEDFRKTRGA